MKKILPYLALLIIATFLLFYAKKTEEFTVVTYNNTSNKPLEIEFGKYLCSDCSMMIKKYKYSSQVILPNKSTYYFDDIGCMIRWLDRQSQKNKAKIFVYTLDTRKYIDPQDAVFSRIENTPIGYGFGAFDKKTIKNNSYYFDYLIGAQSYEIRPYPKDTYSFDDVKIFTLRGETMLNPIIKRHLLGDRIDVDFWSR